MQKKGKAKMAISTVSYKDIVKSSHNAAVTLAKTSLGHRHGDHCSISAMKRSLSISAPSFMSHVAFYRVTHTEGIVAAAQHTTWVTLLQDFERDSWPR